MGVRKTKTTHGLTLGLVVGLVNSTFEYNTLKITVGCLCLGKQSKNNVGVFFVMEPEL